MNHYVTSLQMIVLAAVFFVVVAGAVASWLEYRKSRNRGFSIPRNC